MPLTTAEQALRAARWRRAVLDLVAEEKRHRFPAVLHHGVPGQSHPTVLAAMCRFGDRRQASLLPADQRPQDPAHRSDVLGALLTAHSRRTRQLPALWLTRPGELEMHDVDAAWLGPAARAFAEAGVPFNLAVVTKHGWWEPLSGVRRTWVRARER
jgi:hypothetical protein